MRGSTNDPTNIDGIDHSDSLTAVVLLAGVATAFVINKKMQASRNGPAKYERAPPTELESVNDE
jgi:hypothetical protein